MADPLVITIPVIPPSWNTIMRLPKRGARYQITQGSESARIKQEVWAAILTQHPGLGRPNYPRVTVTLRYHFPTTGRYDPDNYSGKFLMDALVDCGIIIDDSFDVVRLLIERGERHDGTTELIIAPR
jgi:crossover junction endodeoxyribonuclease RusA